MTTITTKHQFGGSSVSQSRHHDLHLSVIFVGIASLSAASVNPAAPTAVHDRNTHRSVRDKEEKCIE